jgi:hypothetical protein
VQKKCYSRIIKITHLMKSKFYFNQYVVSNNMLLLSEGTRIARNSMGTPQNDTLVSGAYMGVHIYSNFRYRIFLDTQRHDYPGTHNFYIIKILSSVDWYHPWKFLIFCKRYTPSILFLLSLLTFLLCLIIRLILKN